MESTFTANGWLKVVPSWTLEEAICKVAEVKPEDVDSSLHESEEDLSLFSSDIMFGSRERSRKSKGNIEWNCVAQNSCWAQQYDMIIHIINYNLTNITNSNNPFNYSSLTNQYT